MKNPMPLFDGPCFFQAGGGKLHLTGLRDHPAGDQVELRGKSPASHARLGLWGFGVADDSRASGLLGLPGIVQLPVQAGDRKRQVAM